MNANYERKSSKILMNELNKKLGKLNNNKLNENDYCQYYKDNNENDDEDGDLYIKNKKGNID